MQSRFGRQYHGRSLIGAGCRTRDAGARDTGFDRSDCLDERDNC